MPHPDPSRDERPEFGYDAGADASYPQRRATRRHRRAAEEPAVATADLWSGGDEAGWSPTGTPGGDAAWDPWSTEGRWTGEPGNGIENWDVPDPLDRAVQAGAAERWSHPAEPDRARPDSAERWDPAPESVGAGRWDRPPEPRSAPDGGLAASGQPLTGDAAVGDLTTETIQRLRSQVEAGVEEPATGDDAVDAGHDDGESDTGRSGERRRRAAKPSGRAGRNLPAAIGVGVGLAGGVLASLLLWRPAFVGVAVLAAGVGTWEMVRAVRRGGAQPPMFPLLVGGTMMIVLSWFGGPVALPLGLMATLLAILVWRLADGAAGYQRDVTAATLIATYVPFLASFAVLLARPDDGELRVLVALLGVVLSDTGGYVTGVLFGRHPMAPSVSPKKSWEGLAGSLVCTAVGSAVVLHLLYTTQWRYGLLFGLAVSAAAVLGDLAESLIKRDLGVKDMSDLLPGHGGLMDRLDSILFAAPTAYAVLTLVVPVVS